MITYILSKRNSIFIKLLLSFMIIVLISFVFNLLSFNFFQGKLRAEIIKYNNLNMSNTVNNFEKQFRLLDDVATNLYFNTNVMILENGRSNLFAMNNLTTEIRTILANYSNLNLENLFFYNDTYTYIIEKGGLTEISAMFEGNYISAQYNTDFWKKQKDENYHMKIFPAAEFQKRNFDGTIENAGLFFPVIIKNKLQKESYIAAFINADAIYLNSHFSVNDLFYMEDEQGTLFYSTSPSETLQRLQPAEKSPAYDSSNHNYYFYQTGEKTRLTYVNVLPNQQIAGEISRLSLILLVLLIICVGLSLLISVWLSFRFKSPVQRMLESLQKMNPHFQLRSSIHEFIQMEDNVKMIIAANQKIHSDLQKNNSLLKKYGYLKKLKSIPGSKDVQHLIDTTKPFYFVMFHLQFTRGHLPEKPILTDHLYEFINLNMMQSFGHSETLQIEKDLIVAILFTETGEPITDKLLPALLSIKHVFDQDQDYYFTIATNLLLRQPSEFTAAYEETLEMIHERRLNAETQIITERSGTSEAFHLSPVEAQELSAHINAGNVSVLMPLIHRLMQQLRKNGKAIVYKQMADEIISQILLALMTQKIEVSGLLAEASPYEQVKEFVSEDQFIAFYSSLIDKAAGLINDKKADKDPIIDYVLAYMNKHYNEDISQEMIADKLNISSGYMGKYIKNKTGQTFGDYLEDIRIRKAKSILEETNDKMHDVAIQVGYTNANSFTRMFRRITGMTPGEYRMNNRIGK